MKRYKVIPLALSGRGKKIYRPGDIVTEENLVTKPDELVAKGFLEELPDETAVPTPEPTAPPAPPIEDKTEEKTEKEPEPTVDKGDQQGQTEPSFMSAAGINEEVAEEPVKAIEDITRKEIIKELKERGADFDENASKKELYAIWVKK